MSKALLILGGLALLFAALVYPVAAVLSGQAVEAYVIAGKDPEAIKIDQQIFEPPKGAAKDSKAYRDAVMEIYGSRADEPTRVLFVPAEKFRRPAELPTLVLLPVDKQKGENPLQVKTVYFLAQKTAIGAAGVGALLLAIGFFTRKKPIK
ncbi:MAG TPA: hypothetical protein VE981_01890 [Planctomycetota bacterium]|nr:hypothetical protein [Planctomycetota bacterium]